MWPCLAVLLLMTPGLPGIVHASQADPQEWTACRTSRDCVWTLGDGGWPVAVNRTHLRQFAERVSALAPYTTYFMLADCIPDADARNAYLTQSQAAVSCERAVCKVTLEAQCQ